MSPRPRLKQGMLAGVAVIALLLASAIAYAGSVTYTYDSLNRLTKAEYEDGRVIQYDYDAAGNRTVLYDSATPPITTAEPPGGYYNSTRSVCLTSHDFSGHGINKTFYCTGSQCSPTTECSSCIINISSTTTLRFYSTDLAGNSEPVGNAFATCAGASYETVIPLTEGSSKFF